MIIFLLFSLLTIPLAYAQDYSMFQTVTLEDTYGEIIGMHETQDNYIIAAYHNSETNLVSLVKIDSTGTILATGTWPFEPEYIYFKVVWLEDHAIIMASTNQDTDLEQRIHRYSYTDLSYDTSFANAGFLSFFGNAILTSFRQYGDHYYVGGMATAIEGTNLVCAPMILRYNLNGTDDSTFNSAMHFKIFSSDDAYLKTFDLETVDITQVDTDLLVYSDVIVLRTAEFLFYVSSNNPASYTPINLNDGITDTPGKGDQVLIPRDAGSFFTITPVSNNSGYSLNLVAYDSDAQPIGSLGSYILITDSAYDSNQKQLTYVNNTFYFKSLLYISEMPLIRISQFSFNGTSLSDSVSTIIYDKVTTSTKKNYFLPTAGTTPYFLLAEDNTIRRITPQPQPNSKKTLQDFIKEYRTPFIA